MNIQNPATRFGILACCILVVTVGAACKRAEAIENIPAGTEVTVVTQDGTLVRGKIARVGPEVVALSGANGEPATEISRTSIAEVKRVRPGEAAPAPVVVTERVRRVSEVREITIPEDTRMDVELNTALASDTSRVEQAVRATVTTPVVVDEITVIPSGSTLLGHVTGVDDSDRVKGRAELGFRFTRLQVGPVTYDIDTKPLYYRAESTKKEDAVKIGVGAAAGALVGALTGGKKGAAIGTAVGAGGGTAVVLATDGEEIRLASGRNLKVSLTSPLIIRTK